ncbi:MAG: AMP-dependent synthetase/ligase [Polyangiales bacterium]
MDACPSTNRRQSPVPVGAKIREIPFFCVSSAATLELVLHTPGSPSMMPTDTTTGMPVAHGEALEPRFSDLVSLQRESVQAFAERPLFGTKRDGRWQWLRYDAFGQQVDALRTVMQAHGVEPGERVAIIADNRPEWAIAAYASYGLKAVFVPMYEHQAAEEWQYILRDSGAVWLFCAHKAIELKISEARATLPTLRQLVVLEDSPEPGNLAWSALLQEAGATAPVAAVTRDTLATLIYTSGTTGKPKGVMLSHGNLAHNVSAALSLHTIGPEDRSLSFLPWAHCFGQVAELHGLIARGASMAIAESTSKIVENLSEIRPTVLVSVPRIFHRIYDGVHKRIAAEAPFKQRLFHLAVRSAEARHAGKRWQRPAWLLSHQLLDKVVLRKVRAPLGGRLRFAISGGAALAPEVARFVAALGIEVYEGYGMTESSPVVAVNRPQAKRLGTVGPLLPGVSVRLDTSVGEDAGEGEIIVYGHGVMQGYFNLPELSTRCMTEDGGLRTGDLGRLENGFLCITGRIKERYKLENGKYVAPVPLEDKLRLAPLIANIMIYGDNRPYNVALVVPDFAALNTWAETAGIDARPPASMCADPRVQRRMLDEINAHADDFRGFERVRKIHLLSADFSIEDGTLTPSLKVKRRVVVQRYQSVIDALYG